MLSQKVSQMSPQFFADGAKAGEALLQDVVPRVDADLIIVGAHSRDGFWDSLGSQAAYIARHAKISSMVARSAK